MILDGNKVAKKLLADLRFKKKPSGKLIVIQVGHNEISSLYVNKKREMALKLNVDFKLINFDEQIIQEKLISEIEKLNEDDTVKGILVQLPLPPHINRFKIARTIERKKDIDGFTYILGATGESFLPPTILAIEEILNFYKINIAGKRIEIVGGGFLVGQPLFRLWKKKAYNVEILKKDSPKYEERIKSADIIVVATGGGGKFSAKNFKSGATVVDASTVSEEGKIRGDVNQENWPDNINLVPVPGGVGSVTVAMLFSNFFGILEKL